KRIRAALSLWRGQPLENAASNWLRERACGDLIERRLAAVEDLMSAYLALRREREVLPELTRAAEEHPERESLVGLHMRALYQAGRRSDALAVYDRARAYLAEEFGLDPGPELRELHQAILRDELEVPAPQAGTSAGSGTGSRSLRPPVRHPGQAPPVPCQLPADVVGFTGFTDQLRQLDALLAQAATTAVPIVALTGTAGVGKTALAVHWAHRVRQAFPDGQLYVNLRGYD